MKVVLEEVVVIGLLYVRRYLRVMELVWRGLGFALWDGPLYGLL